jgi:hypothetical protein
LKTSLEFSECTHCGALVDAGGAGVSDAAAADPADSPPGLPVWCYFRKKGERGGPLYIQRAESWVEVSPQGLHGRYAGTIPQFVRESLEEVLRDEAEAEVDLRDRAFGRDLFAAASRTNQWRFKILLAAPGLPVVVAYLFGLLWFGGVWPPGSAGLMTLLVFSVGPVVLGAFATSLVWASRAGEDAWWPGAVLGGLAVACEVAAGVFELPPFYWSFAILGVAVGFVLGVMGGRFAQYFADRLRLAQQVGRSTWLKPWHLAGAIGALGVLFALAGALKYYL